jgi:Lrp/AsnC family transcriptional regulator for asnA, asnC and gidA
MVRTKKEGYGIVTVPGRIYKKVTYQKVHTASDKKKARPAEKPLDEIDLKILKILKEDARTKLSDIAGELEIGTSTVYKRISRLVEKGVIRQFTVLLDNEKVGLGATAFIGITCQKKNKESVKSALLDINEIVEIHEVLEPYDFLVKVRSPDIKKLKERPLSKLFSIDGVLDIKPILSINTIKETL